MAYVDILRQRAKKSTAVSALNALSPYDILLAPVLTEKAYKASDSDKKDVSKKYLFKVHADANKNDVKQAVLTIYGVEPESVNLLWVKEKGRANRKLVRKSYKKAIVSVAAGKSLPVLDV
ncbi:50S ribosomal protein L23 [Patescibacteria group bacterium]|nr:50S ribosomal protein L23 [Patescibacteria group bacterium]